MRSRSGGDEVDIILALVNGSVTWQLVSDRCAGLVLRGVALGPRGSAHDCHALAHRVRVGAIVEGAITAHLDHGLASVERLSVTGRHLATATVAGIGIGQRH